MFLVVRQFKNTSAMRVSFFPKMFKVESRFRKRTKKLRKGFSSEIIASEYVAITRFYQEERTSHQPSMGEPTILRFFISLRETFSNLIAFTVIKNYAEGAVIKTSTLCHPVYHVIFRRVLSNGTL